MSRTLLAQLSPKEEVTLRLIAQGISKRKYLRAADVLRLQNFGFVEDHDGVARLTPLGEQRTAIVSRWRTEIDL
jgi:hypothetical protein